MLAAAPARSATLSYDFNDRSLQGWHNRAWDLSANGGSGGWVDLEPNVTAMPSWINSGALQPPSGDDQLFGNNGTQVDPVGGQNDNHLNTLWLRSPQFALDGSGDLTVQMARGKAHGTAPADETGVSYTADGTTGWKGVLLRNASSGAFVLAKPRTNEGDAMVTVTFTAAELAPFVGTSCTLDLINSERGGWGWLSMDNVSIPGVLRQLKLAVGAPGIGIGGSTTISITIPADFNATAAVTAYLTNGNPGAIALNGSAAPVIAVAFAAGAAATQNVTVTGTSQGYAGLAVGCAGLESAKANLTVLPPSGLIGRWLTGSEDVQDKSGFTPAGTHDGVMAEGQTATFTTDVPPGATGSALDLSGGAVLIANSASTDAGYQPTFDEAIARQMSVVFWARGLPAGWNPFISKWGEDSAGWQVRRRGDAPVAAFTLRGTPGEDDPYNGSTFIDDGGWHHFAATWDGVSGLRKLYVDGKLNNAVPHDLGPMSLAKGNYLALGGRCGAGSASPGNTFVGQLYDVRVYGVALSGGTVQSLYTGNTGAIVAYTDTPSLDLGQTGLISVSIPDTANATGPVTVSVTNTTPALVGLSGAVGNVVALTFPAGGPTSQSLTLTGLGEGQAQLACAAEGLTSASATVAVYGPHLVGRWFAGAESYTDTAGFSPAGTHDGIEVGTPGGLTFVSDTPPSKSGKAAKFDGTVGLLVGNSSLLDVGYVPTFDSLMAGQFSVSFWAKGIPGTWNGFVSKRGEDSMGWQVRRSGGITEAFTVRGAGSDNADGVGSVAINDGQWHHFAAVWDGYAGVRKCYVDGNLDPSINLTNDFGPMVMAPNHHLVLGAREPAQVSASPNPAIEGGFNGLLYDVQVYNYPLSAVAVKELAFIAALKVAPAQRSLHAPQTMTADVILPAGALQNQAVAVQVRNDTPAAVSLVGSVGNILTLNYPVGGSLTQQVTLAGIADGRAQLTVTGGGFAAGSGAFNVWADPGTRMIGHWLSGAPNLTETAGFRPAGMHDGVAVGANAAWMAFSAEVPPGYTGQSLDLSAGQVAVMITNSSSVDPAYAETFDDQIANRFSVTFWAKGTPADQWNPWVSKRGEDSWGYQIRRFGADDPIRPTFTLRGTAGSDDPYPSKTVESYDWHHYAATWDGATGTRKLFVDGKPVLSLSGDFGPMGLPSANHLMLGGRDNGSFGNFFQGLLFDVRIYSYALDPLAIGVLVNPPTTFSISLTPLVIPQNEIVQLAVTLPTGVTASTPVTVYLTNNSPGVVSFVGAAGNVLQITFPVGTLVQGVNLLAIGPGQINITAGLAGVGTAELGAVSKVVAPKLIGHWFNGATDLLDKSGYSPTGTHDGVAVGANPETLAFSTDVPAGFQGQSLDLTANATGTVGVMIANSAAADAGYLPTFDEDISSVFSLAFWANGVPSGWNGFISKRGENGIGWQVRRGGGDTEAFTIRGTASGNEDGVGSVVITTGGQWHHFAAVWDGVTGVRQCYVDGVLDPSVNLVEDFGPMNLAPEHHLCLGTREQGGLGSFEGWFNGKLCDVRLYNYAITAADIATLAGKVTVPPTLTIRPSTGSQLRVAWPTSFVGYTLQQSSSPTTGWAATGLTVTVEGNENAVYAPTTTTGSQYFRLIK